MQTINQLNEQIRILQNPDLAHLSMVVVVPSSDEIDLNPGKAVITQKNPYHLNLRRNRQDDI